MHFVVTLLAESPPRALQIPVYKNSLLSCATVWTCFTVNNILLMRNSNHASVWKTGADYFLELSKTDLYMKRNLVIESHNNY